MSTLLYRLGKTAFRKPGYFIIGWVLILGIVISMISINGIHISSEMKIEGTESQKVLDQLAKELPAASGGQGSVVFKAPDNERLDTPERLAAITKAVREVYGLKDVINPADYAAEASNSGASADMAQAANMQQSAAASPPPYGPLMVDGVPVPGVLLSSDGKVALFQFQFTIEQSAITQDGFDSVIDSVMTAQQGTNITVLPGETLKTVAIGVGSAEIIGLIIAIIVLLITLGSVVAAGLPLVTALLGVAIGVGGAFSISNFIEMPSVTSVLALMVGLAVGIDYALFIVNRQRRMIIDQRLSAQEATARAIGTSGSAVFFAGLTVIIALCGMLVIGLTFLSTMALVAAATVLINVFVALTLLPALLGLVGERICSPKAREKSTKHPKAAGHGIAHRWVKFVIKYRWITIIAIVVLLGAAATPITKMEMGIPGASSANLDTTARQGYDAISEGFGEGFNGPLILVAEPNNSSAQVTPELVGSLMQELQSQNNVAQVTPLGMTEDLAIFSLIPETGPNDKITKDLVNELRSTESSVAQTNDVKIGVTGFTAVNIDMSAKLAQVFPIYVGIIILLSLIILLLVFRSIIVPIKATIGFLLSILATFGITTAVFQWGWLHSLFGFDTGGPLLSFMPIIVTGILYGLAMDYQVFLVSSMRESYVHGHRGTESVVHGYNQVSRVVVAAAVIMVSVFAGFIFTDDVMIKQIGFTLAVGILIDAFIIRMGLVPAIMAIFGDKAWSLPKWLDRILPNLDVEGEKLIATLNAKDHSNSKF
ncbi:MMPL family transporter [Paenibacillus sp. UMB7766-LJ446]|uniref:MMPL family transporter n=1 Tax=Paenibacillus sp. UMB7766-LJ446 TaxID=3046313 RepID=UPI00254E9003|nr:MMPL family transporter [Paenibacillus sp. UMB7766-LJ446]MDK8189567.1 MMPL family transporter [Paenibacillus sp. UMB7766-LJ446]